MLADRDALDEEFIDSPRFDAVTTLFIAGDSEIFYLDSPEFRLPRILTTGMLQQQSRFTGWVPVLDMGRRAFTDDLHIGAGDSERPLDQVMPGRYSHHASFRG